MDWSFQLYTARNYQPWDKVLQMLGKLGYRKVEGFGGVYDDPAGFKAELDRNGLTMPTSHFDIELLEGDFDRVKRLADTFGVHLVVCPYIPAEQRPSDPAGYRALGERLARIGDKAKRGGYDFAWHNHDFEFVALADGSIPQDILMETAPDMNWEFDVAWCVHGNGDPERWIKKYGSRIPAVHVKDIARPGQGLDEDGFADIGYGTIDWSGMIDTLRAGSAARHFVIEHDNPNDLERFARRSIETANGF